MMKKYSNEDLESMGVFLDDYVIELKNEIKQFEKYIESYKLTEEEILLVTSTLEMMRYKIKLIERGKNISNYINIKKLYKEVKSFGGQ